MIDDKKNIKKLEDFLKRVENCSKLKVAVLGNWEIKSGTYQIIKKLYEKYGFKLLRNDLASDSKVCVYGIDILGFAAAVSEKERINKIKENYCLNKSLIIVSHYPEYLLPYLSKNVCVGLAGHTHGGQVRIPFINKAIYLPPHSDNLESGIYNISGTKVIVSKGVGTYKYFPFRFNCRPDIIIIK
jgi:predicted MPP superfamily phosphohydrolase